MLIIGEWSLDPDGVERPVIRGEVLTAEGDWEPVTFLVDVGADRTVFHAGFVELLGLEPLDDGERISGVGGIAQTIRVATQIRLIRSDDIPVPINGPFGIFTDPLAADCSLLGRDVLNHFALIADHPTKVLWLLHGRHSYTIQES